MQIFDIVKKIKQIAQTVLHISWAIIHLQDLCYIILKIQLYSFLSQ